MAEIGDLFAERGAPRPGPPLVPEHDSGLELGARLLRSDVLHLAGDLGERNDQSAIAYAALQQASSFIRDAFDAAGLSTTLDAVESDRAVFNVIGERPGMMRPRQIVLVGAHYDTAAGAPDADDNATGVAALLGLARTLGRLQSPKTLRLVAFANEALPHTRMPTMGSLQYAAACRTRGERIEAMLSLDGLGFPGTSAQERRSPFRQVLVPQLRPDQLLFVGNLASRDLTKQAVRAFRRHSGIEARVLYLPSSMPGVKPSDHWSFWQKGYRAVMVTDRAFLHQRRRRPADLAVDADYEYLSMVTKGIVGVVRDLGLMSLQTW